MVSQDLPSVAKRILSYLDRIDQSVSGATRMDFLRIAGNEIILNDWIRYLKRCNLIESVSSGPRECYKKTDIGQKVHEVLKLHSYVGPLFNDLGRSRRHKVDGFDKYQFEYETVNS